MEFRQLKYFVGIVDHGSLSRAARALHIAQPALSQQVQQLEAELGVQLLHRSAQGVLATDAGKIFYQHAQAILKQVGDARSAVTQSAERPSGTVALGLPQSASSALALPLLTAVRERYPEITLQITEELTGNLTEQLRAGRINIAVLFDDGLLGQFDTTPMVEEDMFYITRHDSRYAGRAQSISLARAIKAPMILPGLPHGVRPRIEALANAAGLSIDNVIDINSVAILKSALMADMGATILAKAPLLPELEQGLLVAKAIQGPRMSRTLVMCASRTIPLTNAAHAVKRLILDVTDDLCSRHVWPGAHRL